MEETKAFRHIVRVLNTDLDGNKHIVDSLRKIKGIGFSFANITCKLAKIDPSKKTGNLSDEEIAGLNDAIKNAASRVPQWMLNRRKDTETGQNRHVLSSDLDFSRETDIRTMKKIKSYRGIRHSVGLPVRGQRTRSNFRRNKGRGPGVVKKKGTQKGRT